MSRHALAAAAAVAIGAGALAGCGADVTHPPRTQATAPAPAPRSTSTTPADGAAAAPAALRPPLAFHVRRRAQLRAAPDGRVVATIATKTEFKSPTILAVSARRPGWVRVRTAVRHHQLGWLPIGAGALFSQPRTIVIDLSRRTLSLFHRGKLTSTYHVVVGAPATPTPKGRFAITDRLVTGDAAGPYGCCILALTARQPKIAQGWGGGDRVAIHATPETWAIGKAVSHGCVRATNQALHELMRRVRLGTPVTIHA